jgi:putative transposase
VTIPLVGWVRFRWTRPLAGISPGCAGRITGARLIKKTLGWHICFRIEEPMVEVACEPWPSCRHRPWGGPHHGPLARGDARHATPTAPRRGAPPESAGTQGGPPAAHPGTREAEIQAAETYLQADRPYRQIAAMRARQARRREDWLHKTTTQLAKKHGVIAVEDLNITRMTRSARGTVEQPGANVRAKAGLNRSILGMAWGAAGRMFCYKCQANGSVLVKVNPRNSSIECARCGHVSCANRIDQGSFHCEVCAHVANADTNAAQVVLQRGLTALSGATPGCGGTAREARQPRHDVNRMPGFDRVGGHQYTMPVLPRLPSEGGQRSSWALPC